jgi:hypothetical protein
MIYAKDSGGIQFSQQLRSSEPSKESLNLSLSSSIIHTFAMKGRIDLTF